MLKIYLFLSFLSNFVLIDKSIYLFNIISSLIDEDNKRILREFSLYENHLRSKRITGVKMRNWKNSGMEQRCETRTELFFEMFSERYPDL